MVGASPGWLEAPESAGDGDRPVPVTVNRDAAGAWTEGFEALGRRELRVEVDDPTLVDAAAEFLRSTVSPKHLQRVDVHGGTPVAFGSTSVRFAEVDPDGPLVAHEIACPGSAPVRGVSGAARMWTLQAAVCRRQGAEFEPPGPNTLVAVSPDALEPGAMVHGSRHPTPSPQMSGWFLVGLAHAEGDPLQRTTVATVVQARPDIGAYLALPSGYAFRSRRGLSPSIVWDPEVAALVR
jgi:hypothetical protein